tara:strand:- start:1160 stop:1426 length:267 start_codon:yes stop_codon:yes gene_type:complete
MNPFFRTTAFQSTGNQIDAKAAQERLERLGNRSRRAQVRSKQIPGFNAPVASNTKQPVSPAQASKTAPKTNYIPYVIGGIVILYFVTR